MRIPTTALMIMSILAGLGFLLGTHVLFSDALAANAWFQAHRAGAIASFIITASVIYGTLMGVLTYRICREQLAKVPQTVPTRTR